RAGHASHRRSTPAGHPDDPGSRARDGCARRRRATPHRHHLRVAQPQGAAVLSTQSASQPQTLRRPRWRPGASHVVMAIAVFVLTLLAVLAIFADWIAPYDPLHQDLIHALQLPSAAHWLGTDDPGRDVLSRLIYGCRIAVIAAAEGTSIAVLLGVPLGLFIGYRGGWWDWVVMRLVEAIVSIPGIMVAIVIIAILGAGLHRAMIALGILFS